MLNTKVLNRRNGVELLEVCRTHSDGQIEKTWVLKSKRILHYADRELPLKFTDLAEAEKFFHEEVTRCAGRVS